MKDRGDSVACADGVTRSEWRCILPRHDDRKVGWRSPSTVRTCPTGPGDERRSVGAFCFRTK